MRTLTLLATVALLAGCGGGQASSLAPGSTPDRDTRATVGGHRCVSPTRCVCRDRAAPEDQFERTPPDGTLRRFEIRLATVRGVAWLKIDGEDQLYKDNERPEDCWYVDLPPGPHTFALHTKAVNEQEGVGIGLHIETYGASSGAWYESFVFDCGLPGPCAAPDMAAWKEIVQGDRRAMRDPCAETRIMDLKWETGRMPDNEHPADLTMAFGLMVRDRQPSEKPRDPACPEK